MKAQGAALGNQHHNAPKACKGDTSAALTGLADVTQGCALGFLSAGPLGLRSDRTICAGLTYAPTVVAAASSCQALRRRSQRSRAM